MKIVAGIDEVGLGAIAGPLVLGVTLIQDGIVPGVKDSKQLTPAQRMLLNHSIAAAAKYSNIVTISVWEIERFGMAAAWELGISKLVALVRKEGKAFCDIPICIDGNRVPKRLEKENVFPMVKGDQLHYGCSAASIIAKHTRDESMKVLHGSYPNYGFFRNMGYGTPEHKMALGIYGPCAIHRKQFVKTFMGW